MGPSTHFSLAAETLPLVFLRFTRCFRMDSSYSHQNNFHLWEPPTQIREDNPPPSFTLSFKTEGKRRSALPNSSELQERPGPEYATPTGHRHLTPFPSSGPAMAAPQVRESASRKVKRLFKVTQLERITVIQTPGL